MSASNAPLPQASQLRCRVFLDFWNFQLSMNSTFGRGYKIDWKGLGPWISNQANGLLSGVGVAQYEGLHVYLSHGQTPKGAGLKNWATNVLDRFPGVTVTLKERKPKNPPRCPSCHKTISTCPHCQKGTAGFVEKGIDTAIVTDMVSLAWKSSYDVAILVSSDSDFIPAVEFLDSKSIKTINAHFPPAGMGLARQCWASIDLKKSPPPQR